VTAVPRRPALPVGAGVSVAWTGRGFALFAGAILAAVPCRAHSQRIMPERVFPDLPPPSPPADFLSMSLYLQLPPVHPGQRHAFERTGLTVGQFLAVLPPDRKWRKSTADNAWRLFLNELRIDGRTLANISMLFIEDNMAAPSNAASFPSMSIGGVPSSAVERDRVGRAIVALARNAI
jgi:hypothetical protein